MTQSLTSQYLNTIRELHSSNEKEVDAKLQKIYEQYHETLGFTLYDVKKHYYNCNPK
jgi:hypothetical protein